MSLMRFENAGNEAAAAVADSESESESPTAAPAPAPAPAVGTWSGPAGVSAMKGYIHLIITSYCCCCGVKSR